MRIHSPSHIRAVVLEVGLCVLLALSVSAQDKAVGSFESQSDVGQVKYKGSAAYEVSTGEYTLSGSGTNMWTNKDEFHFMWKRLRGDFILTARVRFIGNGVDPHRKIGWIIRTGTETDSAQASAVVHGNGLTSLQFRRTAGANTEQKVVPLKGADVIQLERKGN